ncbi:hypothetical protein [Salinithrix halophila]|uniref:hypothetical protein n=1 Tax=Salinithrix halophila TaxID=1485204 RepID=UPI0036D2CA55
MFFHGIPFIHLIRQFPVLASGSRGNRRSPTQAEDARSLRESLGFVPVHLLRSSREYPMEVCLRECLRYGDTVLAFPTIPYPRVQLSRREWGVPKLAVEEAAWVFTTRETSLGWLRKHLPERPLLLMQPGTIGHRRHLSPRLRP